MATYDLVGVPFPVIHPVFSKDKRLLRKVKRVENLIELKADMEELERVIETLKICLDEDLSGLIEKYGIGGMHMPDFILSYVVIMYGKAFTEGIGRTQLHGEVKKIFGNETDNHASVMDLRHHFYAHHGIEANRHQIFCLPNMPEKGRVKLNPGGQISRIIMARSIDVEVISYCVNKVKKYLSESIEGLCNDIENSLNAEQRKVINETPKDELLDKYWIESTENRGSPFKMRKR